MTPKQLCLSLLLSTLFVSAYAEKPSLAHVFQDNMVLQRGMPVPVWGWASSGARVQLSFDGQHKSTKAGTDGYWNVILDPLSANPKGQVLRMEADDASLECKNVLVGEVWLASGQSNMLWEAKDEDTGVYPFYEVKASSARPEVRVARYGWGASMEPLADTDPAFRRAVPWRVLDENPPPAKMGPADYFARVLRDGLDVPVGVILVAVSGTNQTAWMQKETIEQFPGNGHGNFYEAFLAKHIERHQDKVSWEAFKVQEDQWRETAALPALRDWPARRMLHINNYPSVLYNTRIHPLAPFAFRGHIWHQGEGGPSGNYGERLVAMVNQWRALFKHDFYFVWGTLSRRTTMPPPLIPKTKAFYRSKNNVSIRQAIEHFGDSSKAEMVELYDLGNDDTHFGLKSQMGRRYGLAALSLAYGQDHIYTGPRPTEKAIEGAQAVVKFAHVGNGLRYAPSIEGISGIYLLGENRERRWADVEIVGKDKMVLSHPDIRAIKSVQYANYPNPHETLFNSDNLPASPFSINPLVDREKLVEPYQLLAKQGGPEKARLHVAHVRRHGYVFELHLQGAEAEIPILAYIPDEWRSYEIELGGKLIQGKEVSDQGRRLVALTVPTSVTVRIAEAGKMSKLQNVNRY